MSGSTPFPPMLSVYSYMQLLCDVLHLQMISYVGEYYPVTYEKTGKYVCNIVRYVVNVTVSIYCRYTTLGVPSVYIFHMIFVCTLE